MHIIATEFTRGHYPEYPGQKQLRKVLPYWFYRESNLKPSHVSTRSANTYVAVIVTLATC